VLASTSAPSRVYRVGYAPDPWAWVPWEYADRSTGRWDDLHSTYRVIYAASSPEACFVEVLAQFRPDPNLAGGLGSIESDPRDDLYPSVGPGVVPSTWLDHRLLGSAALGGLFCDVTDKNTIAALRPTFLTRAMHYSLPDFDAATIRLHEPRRLTQEISRYLYEHEEERFAGITYESRFGAGLSLWAIFERSDDQRLDQSSRVNDTAVQPINRNDPAFVAAFALHGLTFEF
jgi:hypothetical protein